MRVEDHGSLEEWRDAARSRAWRSLVRQAGLALVIGTLLAVVHYCLAGAYLAARLAQPGVAMAIMSNSGIDQLQTRTGMTLQQLRQEQVQLVTMLEVTRKSQCEQQRWLDFIGQLQQQLVPEGRGPALALQRLAVRQHQAVLELAGPLAAVNQLLGQWQRDDADSHAMLLEHRPGQGQGLSRVRITLKDECWARGKMDPQAASSEAEMPYGQHS